MREEAAHDRTALENLRFRMREVRASPMAEEIGRQRLRIAELAQDVDAQIEWQEGLKDEIAFMNQMQFVRTTDEIDDTEEIRDLLNELHRKSEQRKKKSRQLAKIIDQNETEIIFENLKAEQKIKGLRSLFVGWFDSETTIAEVREMFEPIGTIEAVRLDTRKFRGETRICARLMFATHQQAEKAIQEMNGLTLVDRKLLVLWDDEQIAVKPPQQVRAKANPRRRTAKREVLFVTEREVTEVRGKRKSESSCA
jgi:RNA recognition motif-containing protein